MALTSVHPLLHLSCSHGWCQCRRWSCPLYLPQPLHQLLWRPSLLRQFPYPRPARTRPWIWTRLIEFDLHPPFPKVKFRSLYDRDAASQSFPHDQGATKSLGGLRASYPTPTLPPCLRSTRPVSENVTSYRLPFTHCKTPNPSYPTLFPYVNLPHRAPHNPPSPRFLFRCTCFLFVFRIGLPYTFIFSLVIYRALSSFDCLVHFR